MSNMLRVFTELVCYIRLLTYDGLEARGQWSALTESGRIS